MILFARRRTKVRREARFIRSIKHENFTMIIFKIFRGSTGFIYLQNPLLYIVLCGLRFFYIPLFLLWHTSLIAQPEQPPQEQECLPFFLFLKWKKITRANSTATTEATIKVGQSIFTYLLLIFSFYFFCVYFSYICFFSAT